MADELTYALITPHSIGKSRTGGILARLISRTGLDVVGAQMFSPSKELVEEFAATIKKGGESYQEEAQTLIREYLLTHFVRSRKLRTRVMLVCFRGEDAVAKVRDAVGHITHEGLSGLTIRDTYGDLVKNEAGEVVYFEPAVLCPRDAESAVRDLKLWAKYSGTDGGVLRDVIEFPEGANVEETLVLIKPDNFRFPSARPGNVIDVFSRTGLYMIGIKVHRMTVAQAEEFYGPVLEVLQNKFKASIGKQIKLAAEEVLGYEVPAEMEPELGETFGPMAGRRNWEAIVHFMTGRYPSATAPEMRDAPGLEKCIALIYQGVDAVKKIREVLGPTDPAKAPSGTIRREFGQTIMVNAAHASDSPENARREMGIIRISENNIKEIVGSFYGE
jgi:nucleoside diphosphate kinase